MRIRVLKFGGTSVLTPERRADAVARVREARDGGVPVVVVVSAIGRRGDPYATDTLLELARGLHADPAPRELAMLAACGEVIAAVVVAGTLRRAGIPATALTGAQAGIRTVHGYAGAVILSLDPGGVLDAVRRGEVPVVTGFQGANPAGEVTLLQRGGSDISATALGYALGAERVDIYTDVPGVMTADPRLVPEARTIAALGFRQALLMARAGARVIHPQALSWAMRGPVPLRVLSAAEPARASHIGPAAAEGDEGMVGIAARATDGGRAVVSVVGTPAAMRDPSVSTLVRETLEGEGIAVHALEPSAEVVAASIPSEETASAARALHALFLGAPSAAVLAAGPA